MCSVNHTIDMTTYTGKINITPRPNGIQRQALDNVMDEFLTGDDERFVGTAFIQLQWKGFGDVWLEWTGADTPNDTMANQIQYTINEFKQRLDRPQDPIFMFNGVFEVEPENVNTFGPYKIVVADNLVTCERDRKSDNPEKIIMDDEDGFERGIASKERIEITREHIEKLHQFLEEDHPECDLSNYHLCGPMYRCPANHKCSSNGGEQVDRSWEGDDKTKFCLECGQAVIPCASSVERALLECNGLYKILNKMFNG
jgi:hypothetical protein